jgi:acyl-CoA synthetase (NDP forming)
MDRLLLGIDALAFLEEEGLPVLESSLAKHVDAAVSIASRMRFPVALKISSPNVVHKTEFGGIRLPLHSESEVREAFHELADTFLSSNPQANLEGVIVQKLGKGFELIVGTMKDEQFGPVLMVGSGGIFVEAINDTSFRLIPIEGTDAREMIEELRGCKVLKNQRTMTVDLATIESFLLQTSTLAESHPEIHEMDLNPVFVSADGIAVCDARIRMG